MDMDHLQWNGYIEMAEMMINYHDANKLVLKIMFDLSGPKSCCEMQLFYSNAAHKLGNVCFPEIVTLRLLDETDPL